MTCQPRLSSFAARQAVSAAGEGKQPELGSGSWGGQPGWERPARCGTVEPARTAPSRAFLGSKARRSSKKPSPLTETCLRRCQADTFLETPFWVTGARVQISLLDQLRGFFVFTKTSPASFLNCAETCASCLQCGHSSSTAKELRSFLSGFALIPFILSLIGF